MQRRICKTLLFFSVMYCNGGSIIHMHMHQNAFLICTLGTRTTFQIEPTEKPRLME